MSKRKNKLPRTVRLELDLEVTRGALAFIVAALENAEACDLPEEDAVDVFAITAQLNDMLDGCTP